MSTVALVGKDTVKINDRILADLCDQDTCLLDFPNDLMAVKTGKNGNSIYAFNYTGRQVEVTLRVLRGSSDDKFLNNLLQLMIGNPPAFVLLNATFVKNIGDGAGGIQADTYVLAGGVFKKNVPAKENAEGDTEQAISVYALAFSNSPRAIG